MKSFKIALVDFDDSFTSNIDEVLTRIGHKVTTIHWSLFSYKAILDNFEVLCLGPGPGHINEYHELVGEMEKLKDFPVLGVCLGHQILGFLLGLKLIQLESPLHGKSLGLKNCGDFLDLDGLRGQFYNSWALVEHNEIKSDQNSLDKLSVVTDFQMICLLHSKSWISCQFHPESVGTSFPENVVRKLLQKIV